MTPLYLKSSMVEIDVSAVQLHIGRYAECECKRVSVRKRQGKWMREREREAVKDTSDFCIRPN